MPAAAELRRDGERPEMHDVIGPAGKACGLAESNHRTADLVDEKIAALQEIVEDAAEAPRIDPVEGQEPRDEFVGVDGKEC
jgi:hypothetical protein